MKTKECFFLLIFDLLRLYLICQDVNCICLFKNNNQKKKGSLMKLLAKLVLALMMFSTAYYAMGVEEVDNVMESGPVEKLGRGIANVAFGPLELLIRPYDVTQDKGAIAGLTFGVLKGVCYTVLRAGVGYGPIMRPAWVVDTEHNAFNFFFEDNTIANGD